MPNGVTKVVTLDDEGNLIEDVAPTKPADTAPPPDPDPPPHRRRNRR
jgi:hypothetical protein